MSYLEYYILVRLEPYWRAAWYSFSGFIAAQLAALICSSCMVNSLSIAVYPHW